MSIEYVSVLAAIVNRLIADTTIGTNIGTLGDSLVKCIFNLRAHPDATSDKPTIVVRRVDSPQVSDFSKTAVRMRFDVHLYYGNGKTMDPGGTGHNCFAILSAIRDSLDGYVPTASGMTCSAIFFENEIDAHDDEEWHWVQSYTVHLTET